MKPYSLANKRNSNKILNEGMEALRQIATTSLFMQNEQKSSSSRVVPIIKEPENIGECIFMKTASCDETSDMIYKQNAKLYNMVYSSEEPESRVNESTESNVNIDAQCTASLEQQNTLLPSMPIPEEVTASPTSKLSRTRMALNHKIIPQAPFIAKNDANDKGLLMETSLSIIKSSTIVSGLALSVIPGTNFAAENETCNASGFTHNEALPTPTVSRKICVINPLSEPKSNMASNLLSLNKSNTNISASNTPIITSKSKCQSAESIYLPGQIDEKVASEKNLITESNNNKNSQISMPKFLNTRFMFPFPPSNSDSESEGSPELSPSQSTVIQTKLPGRDQSPNASAASNISISPDNIYDPQQNQSKNAFESELLLSPAKLGQ
ncbi:PREDICTED: uncharacterized protein LOC108359240 [Rhagoletis zephyria]|uniref:uncharacterized protein LOC108359240 n=1 Tax=Rhagoletis zephyria TaxID=28612 RepID=UPI0008115E75|nr:PREDICTED: uncharacterized protein LOC108359240 [Rhagoletis zephyria]